MNQVSNKENQKKSIKVKNLSKVFGRVVAVNQIDFEVEPNKIFGILGPNGSGKTTTLRMLATILAPTSGEIIIKDLSYKDNAQNIRKKIGYVPQKDALYSSLTVWENVDLFFSAYAYEGDRKQRISQILKRVNLLEKKNVLAGGLSGGMAKRLSIACAIAHKPKVIFFDEVTMGLDPHSRQSIWSLVKELKESATVVMTTHYMDEAEKLCDELIIMKEGSIIADGAPEAILKKFKVENLDMVFAEINK